MKIAVGLFNAGNNVKTNRAYKFNLYAFLKYIFLIAIFTIFTAVIGRVLLKKRIINSNMLYVASNINSVKKNKVSKINIMLALNKNSAPFKNLKTYSDDIVKNEVENVDKAGKKCSTELNISLIDTVEVVSKKDKDNLSVTESGNVQKINVYGMSISNYSSKRNIDILSLFSKNITLTKKSDPVLIYCTHTSESYTNSERYKFDYSSTYRSRDAKYNMLSVANILSTALEERNIQTIFETTPHDYGNYEIAYTNSRKTIENAMQQNERIGLSIDVHRDALGDLTQGTTVEIKGQKVARLMFVMGVGTDSYANKYWEDNLALALQLQKLGEEMYPGLFRGLIIRNSKYNQDLIKHSFLVEVGTTGNTLEEAYFGARCLANILNKFYNN